MGRRPLDAVRIAAGVAGVVLAHVIDYRVVYPSAAERAHAMAASGHGYWPLAVSAAMLAAGLTATAAVVRGATGRGGARPRLAGFQVGLFALVEVGERLAAGRSPASVLHMLAERTFLLGIAVQVVVAAAVFVVVAALERLGRRAAAYLRTTKRRVRRAMPGVCSAPLPITNAVWSPSAARAPPALVP